MKLELVHLLDPKDHEQKAVPERDLRSREGPAVPDPREAGKLMSFGFPPESTELYDIIGKAIKLRLLEKDNRD